MKCAEWAGLWTATLIAVAAVTADAANGPTYILNGYSFGRMPGVNTAELEAKLKDKPGARITQSDVAADKAIVARELKARHLTGQLFATIAEKKGRVWIIFDLLDLGPPPGHAWTSRYLESQVFEGESGISVDALAAATGLKPGEQLSVEKINAARRAILAVYTKSMPGKKLTLKGRMQTKPDGGTSLIWIIGQPQ
jgi:hypothetical protein